MHAQRWDVARGKERFPVLAIGWELMTEPRSQHILKTEAHTCHYLDETEYKWQPAGGGLPLQAATGSSSDTCSDRTGLTAEPLPFEYQLGGQIGQRSEESTWQISPCTAQANSRTTPARGADAATTSARTDDGFESQRCRALNRANRAPPLLHLIHHIVCQQDCSAAIRSAGGARPQDQTSRQILPRMRQFQVEYGQPIGWGVMVDVAVAAETVIGEYVGERKQRSGSGSNGGTKSSSDSSDYASSDDDEEQEERDEETRGEKNSPEEGPFGHALSARPHSLRAPLETVLPACSSDQRRVLNGADRRRMYRMQLSTGDRIEPHLQGNWTRFINHSFAPNVRYEEWTLPRLAADDGTLTGFEQRVAVITNCAIRPNTELFADYTRFHMTEWPYRS